MDHQYSILGDLYPSSLQRASPTACFMISSAQLPLTTALAASLILLDNDALSGCHPRFATA
jgi:hypothetical protein